MKKFTSIILCAVFLLTLCSCGGGKPEEQPTETDTQHIIQTPDTEPSGPSAELIEAVAPFQGEWRRSEYGKVVINKDTVSFIHENEISGKKYTSVYTFLFMFAEDGTLVISNEHGQPRKTAVILSDGTLQIQSIGGDEPDIYKWASDSTAVPAEKSDPKIGMTELEVYGSSWGYPKSKNKTTTAAGTREQWVYYYGYIYLTDGIVTAIQEK